MRPESDLAISECMRFFPVYTVIEQIRSVSHMSKKIRIGSHLTDSVNETKDAVAPNPLTKEESRCVYKCDDERLSGSTKRWIFKSM